jgi:branched-subunit amino acid transport protein
MIESQYFWTIIFILAAGTLLIRVSIIAISSRVQITGRVKQIFSFIPAAVLPAMAVPMVFYHQGHIEWIGGKERLIVLLLATAVAYFTRKMTVTLIFGLLALYVLTQTY